MYSFSFIGTNFRYGRRVSLGASVLRGILTLVLLNQIKSNILGLVGSDVLGSIQRLVRSCV